MENLNVKNEKNNFIITICKGGLFSLCFSLILILIFAFILRFITIDDSVISPVVSIIKGTSILVGTFLAMKNIKEMGFITGLIIGLTYIIISFICFSILDSFTFEFNKTLLNDIIFGTIIGGISGIIAVNCKKSK